MRSAWRRVGAFLSMLVPLAGCSDDAVDFPDAGGTGGADAGHDVSVDTARPDVSPDVSTEPPVDATVDATVDAGGAETAPDHIVIDQLPPPDDRTDDGAPPDATDDPPVGDAIGDATSEDGPGCESLCASGVCDANGDCTPCVRDEECTGGRVCNAGTCGPRCGDGGVACTGNLVCCNDHCRDVTRDPQHCGACATTCSATQFCGNASTPSCQDTVLRNVCNTKKATFLLDGLGDDDAASGVLRNAIATLCMPVPTLTSILQTVTPAINPTTGQPLAGGGELLVVAGGDSWQRHVRWLERSGTASVYNETDGITQLQWRLRSGLPDGGDSVITTIPLSAVTPTHDYFLIEVVKDPISGTFSLVVYGIDSPGTRAGAFYFANVMLPSMVGADVTTFTHAWYIYEWTSATDGGTGPSMGDTFTQVAAGL